MGKMKILLLTLILTSALEETKTESCRDVLQGYLSGQSSCAQGMYQHEALKREFKSFTNVIEQSMAEFKEKVKAEMQIIKDDSNKSIVYTRWGKKTCPTQAELILSGFTGGSWYGHSGAAAEPLCLPRDPEWSFYKDGTDGAKAYVFGAEYETHSFSGFKKTLAEHDVPCAVCLLRNRSVVNMFPARKTCRKGWTLEYHGYLMAGHHGQTAGTTYTCVDNNPDTLHGGHSNHNGYLLYPVEARCGSLKCPPYTEGRELVCAVCSKI
nr:uncharacterized protein LOC105320069 [Crassostrea gigas]